MSTCPINGFSNKVLLDFDGVVFRNIGVHSYVANRSSKWLAEHSKTNTKSASIQSEYVYRKKGHTSLYDGFNVEALSSYNEYVFDDNIRDIVALSVSAQDKDRIENFLTIKKNRNLEYILCTNAPSMFCEIVLNSLGYDITEFFDFTDHYMLTSDKLKDIKPQASFFEKSESALSCLFDSPMDHLHFIDDSPMNVNSANARGWHAALAFDDTFNYRYLNEFRIDKRSYKH